MKSDDYGINEQSRVSQIITEIATKQLVVKMLLKEIDDLIEELEGYSNETR